MLQLNDLEEAFWHARKRDLKPMDGFTLLAVMSQTNWSSGKAETTSAKLGELLGTDERLIRSSLSRLKKCRLVSMFREGNGFFYAVHPGMVKVGRTDSRNLMVHRWKEEGLL